MSELKRPAAAQAAAIERWALPEVGGPVLNRPRDDRKAGAAPDALRAALQEAETRGYQAGVAKAQAEAQVSLDALAAHVQQLDSIMNVLARPLQQLDDEIEKELLQIALAVGKQLARRELRVDPTQVIAIIRESLSQLPSSAREARIHMHPEDAATVRERLAVPTNERAWTIVEDPTLTRGGCLVRSESSQIDMRVESRINAVIANALGEERAPERSSNPETEE